MYGLCHRTDIRVEKLPAEVTREEFILWRDSLDDYLEAMPGWQKSTKLLEKLHRMRSEITISGLQELETQLYRSASTPAVLEERARTLFQLLRSKQNVTLRSFCKEALDYNGFEVYRRLSLKYAPAAEAPDLLLYDQVCSFRDLKCKSFEETYETAKKFKRIIKEHDVAVAGKGQPIEERNISHTLWKFMDFATQKRADLRPELRREKRCSETLFAFIEEIHVDNDIEQTYKKGVAPMDIGAVEPGSGADASQPSANGRYTAEEWMQWCPAPPEPEADWNQNNHVDALGKGKGIVSTPPALDLPTPLLFLDCSYYFCSTSCQDVLNPEMISLLLVFWQSLEVLLQSSGNAHMRFGHARDTMALQ